MIIDMERKWSLFPWRSRKTLIPCFHERPNKTSNFTRAVWDFMFYGPDVFTDVLDENREEMGKKQDMSALFEMVKELQKQNAVLQKQNAVLQNKMLEIQNEFTMERNRRSMEYVRMSQDKRNATTEFRGNISYL